MTRSRLEAFSDGVLAIVITIMVFNLKPPLVPRLSALAAVWQELLCYVLSFVYIGIYWNNHHHLFQAVRRVNGAVLLANQHLLFWLTLVPFVTGWLGASSFAAGPTAAYGVVLFLAASAYWILTRTLLALHGAESDLARALGRDRKGLASLLTYAVAIGVAFVEPWAACLLYAAVAAAWLVPDARMERALSGRREPADAHPSVNTSTN
jgi:uncharacterized membrane protein